MLAPELRALGFDFATMDDFANAINQEPMKLIHDVAPFEAVGLYQDQSGAAVAFLDLYNHPVYMTPSLQGTRGHRVDAYQWSPSMAYLHLYLDDDTEPTHSLLAAVDDPHCYPVYGFAPKKPVARFDDYRLSGTAIDIKVYPTEKEWRQHRTPHDNSTSGNPELSGDTYINPRRIRSPWIAPSFNKNGLLESSDATSMITGVIQKTELRTNQLSGQEWWRCEVDCGFPITVALPGDIEPPPMPKSVIEGKILLLGSTGFWEQIPSTSRTELYDTEPDVATEVPYKPIDYTKPPGPEVEGVSAEILREVVARIDNDADKEQVLEFYYYGESSVDGSMLNALCYVSEKGWKLDRSYLPRVLEVSATLDYAPDVFEYVDFNIFEDGDEATQLEPSIKSIGAQVLSEVLLQVPNEEERKRILAPLHNEDYQVEDLVWVALDYAAKNDIKLEKVYWPHLARLAQAINREDLLEEVDRSIFE